MEQERAGKGKIILTAVLTVLLLILAGGIYLFVENTRVDTIIIEGNSRYSDSELLSLIFPGEKDRRTVNIWWNEQRGNHRMIPFVSRYEITLTGLHSAEIMVYEKNVVACLQYMGSIMYFDKDGIVVESGDVNTEGVPVITGIDFSQIIMYQPISVGNEEIFHNILNLTQLLSLYELEVDRIYYDDALNVRLYIGALKAELGSSQYLDEKIIELKSILPQIEGRAGTLYLDNYNPDTTNPGYRFKPESSEPENSEPENSEPENSEPESSEPENGEPEEQ